MREVSECCQAEMETEYRVEYPDGPIGIYYTEEVCSKCKCPAEVIEAPPTCEDCKSGQYNPDHTKFFCKHSGREMNPAYKSGECKFFEQEEYQLTIGGEDIGEP